MRLEARMVGDEICGLPDPGKGCWSILAEKAVRSLSHAFADQSAVTPSRD